LTQRSRVLGAVIGLLLLGVVLSACGAAPVAQNWPGLTVEGDTIYAISGLPQQVYMLDAETAIQKATFMPQGEHRGVVYWSPVTLGEDLAFVGFAEDGADVAGLYAFDPETGQEQWNIPVKNLVLPAPTYDDGVVYFGDSDGFVYAVDVESRSIKPGWPFEAKDAIWASPLVAGGRVYVAGMGHYLYCLDAESGQVLWEREIGAAMAKSPTLEDGILYVGAFDGKVHAIEVWNEQNLDREWMTPQGLSPASYVQFLSQAHETVKTHDPNIIIISGALAPTGIHDGVTSYDDFLYIDEALAAGMLNYADCVGAHHNGYNIGPNVPYETAGSEAEAATAIFRGPFDNPHHSWSFKTTVDTYAQKVQALGSGTPKGREVKNSITRHG